MLEEMLVNIWQFLFATWWTSLVYRESSFHLLPAFVPLLYFSCYLTLFLLFLPKSVVIVVTVIHDQSPGG